MNGHIIWNIAVKDWKEVRQNRMAWMPALIVPLIFDVILPTVIIAVPQMFGGVTEDSIKDFQPLLDMAPPVMAAQLTGLNTHQTLIVVILGFMFAPLFLILPLMVASIIGADSIVGEEERKTLEALLYTPATDRELYLAKLLSAVGPAVALSWVSFLLYVIIVNLAGLPIMGRVWFPLPHWYPLILWVSPAVAVLGMAIIVLVSSRVSTFMEAQQTSGLLVLPLVLLVVGQAVGVIYLSVELVIVLGVIIWIIDAGLIWLGVKQFSRSSLMARI
jgi:ABC-type transport system involved in multi-copper enzyme maturation permease subunit